MRGLLLASIFLSIVVFPASSAESYQSLGDAGLGSLKSLYARYRRDCSRVCTPSCKDRWRRLDNFRRQRGFNVDTSETAVCAAQP